MTVTKEYYSGLRPEMADFLPDKYEKVLEIGCAEGDFSVHLSSAKEKWGVEMNIPSARIAASKLDKVLAGKYEEVIDNLPDGYFDLIICNDVIEHMADHDFFFESVKSKLKENGRLVLSIPNVRYIRNLGELLIQKDWKYRDQGTLDRTHMRFFTEKSIKEILREHGYIIEKFSGIKKCPNIAGKVIVTILSVLSAGYYSDINYLDFGMRVRLAETKAKEIINKKAV